MGALDKYLNTPSSSKTTTKEIYNTALSIYQQEEAKKMLEESIGENMAVYPKKPENYDEMVENSKYDNEYQKVRTELGIDILNKNLENHIANRIKDGTGISAYNENLARTEFAPSFERLRTQLENNEIEYINRIGKEKYIELYNEINSNTRVESKKTNKGADYEYGKLQIESSLAWNDYLNSGLFLDKAKALEKDKELNQYYEEHYKELGNDILSGTAEYLPQMGYQLKNNAPAYIAGLVSGGIAGIASKSPQVGLKTGQTVTAVGSSITGSMASYNLIRGGIYRDLIQMGVPENIAREASSDSAFWQSAIEGIENFVSLKALFKSPASAPVKQKIKDYIKGYGINILTEGLEEGSQEIVGIVYEKGALEKSGLDTSEYSFANVYERVKEATFGGMEIAITVGFADTAVNITFNESLSAISKHSAKAKIKQNIENSYNEKIKSAKEMNDTKLVENLEKAKEQFTSDKSLESFYEEITSIEARKKAQENIDTNKTIKVNYKNQETINSKITEIQNKLREELKNETIKFELNTEINKVQENIKTALEKITKGKYEVAYFKTENILEDINEFVDPNSKIIYLNSNMQAKDTTAVFWHGFGHFIGKENKDLIDTFKNQVGISKEMIKQYRQTITYDLTDNEVIEEMFGDYVGELLSKEENMALLEKESKTLADKIKDVVRNFVTNATGIEIPQNTTTQYSLSETSRLEGINSIAYPELNKQIIDFISKGTNDLQSKFNEMKQNKIVEPKIKQMIAKALNIKDYNVLRRNKDVEKTYSELERNYQESIKYSRRKSETIITDDFMYNPYGINQEISTMDKLRSAINTDTPNLKLGINIKEFGDFVYIFDKKAFDEYNVLAEMIIEGNEEIIDVMREGIENEVVREPEFINRIFQDNTFKRGRNNRTNANVEDRRSTRSNVGLGERDIHRETRIAERRPRSQKESIGNIRQNSSTTSNKKELEDSSSFKFSRKKKKTNEEIIANQRNEIEKQRNKEIAIEMNAKRSGRKELVKRLEKADIKLKKQRTDSKTSKDKEVLRIRWTNAKDKSAIKNKETITDNRKVQDILNKQGYSKEAIVNQARKEQRIEQVKKTIIDEKRSKELERKIRETIKTLKAKNVYNKLPNDLKAQVDSFNDIYLGGNTKTLDKRYKELLKSYAIEELMNNPNFNVSEKLKEAIKDPEKISISSYGTTEDLEYLYDSINELSNAIKDVFAFRGSNENLVEVRQKFIEEAKELDRVKSTKKILKGLGYVASESKNWYLTGMSTLHTEILRLTGGNPNSIFHLLEENLQGGETRHREAIVVLNSIYSDYIKKNNFTVDSFEKELRDAFGQKAKWVDTGITYKNRFGEEKKLFLTRGMMMALAMHAKNTDNLKHITGQIVDVKIEEGAVTPVEIKGGGIVVPNAELYKRNIDKAYKQGDTVKLTVKQVNEIVSKLTPLEKDFVDTTAEFFEKTSELVNEVSNDVLGYDIATVLNYFPIRVDPTTVYKKMIDPKNPDSLSMLTGSSDLLEAMGVVNNLSMLKQRTSNAYNPLYLEDISSVITRTQDNVAMYYGYAKALYDNNLILNTKTENESLENIVNHTNPEFYKYYRELTNSIVGLNKKDSLTSKAKGLHAKFTLSYNVGVMAKQAGSLFTILKYIDNPEAIKGFFEWNFGEKIKNYYSQELGIDIKEEKYNDLVRAFLKIATPDIEYRRLGYRTPELKELYAKKNIFERMKFGQGISVVDNFTVLTVAKIIAYDLSLNDNIKFGSQEYFDILGNRLNEVLRRTQPDYSEINRTGFQRSNNIVAQAITMYSTPMLQLFNSVLSSSLELNWAMKNGTQQEKKKYSKKLVKAVAGLILSSAYVTAVSGMKAKYLDDNDEFDFVESLAINMLAPTLLFDDIISGLIGNTTYDFSTADLDWFNIAVTLPTDIKNLINYAMSDNEADRSKVWSSLVRIVKDGGQLTGLPLKDLYNAVNTVMLWSGNKSLKLYTTPNAYKKWLENKMPDASEFYKVYEVTREKKLISDFGYVKKSQKESEQKKQAMKRAIQSVTADSKKVKTYMEIFGGYKS